MKALFCPEFPINLEIPVVFSKKYVLKPHLFSGKAQIADKKPISDKIFVSALSWATLFYMFSVTTFSYKRFPSFHTKNLWCYA